MEHAGLTVSFFTFSSPDIISSSMNYVATLREAAAEGRLSKIKSLVQNGADVLAKAKEYGVMPMHLSAINGHTDCVEYFLEQGVDVNASNENGLTCAHHAAYANHLETLKMLTKYDVNIETRCKENGNRPVEQAAYRGNFDCVEYLIQQGSNLNSLSPQGRSVLYNAADGGHLKIIKFLADRGADLNVRVGKHGYSLIHCTAFRAHERCLEYFLDLGMDVNLPNEHGSTPIMSAALGGHLNIIQFLVKRGADLNVQENKYGDSLIHSAAFGGDVDCLRYFLVKDNDKDLPNKHGSTPIMIAALGGHLNIIKFLDKQGADLNVQESKYGDSLIHSAAFGGDIDCLRYFLDKDINKDLPNKHGATPIMSAALGGHLNIIEFLVDLGADLNVQESKYGSHLIHSAAFGGDVDCLRYFLDMDFDVDLWDKHGVTPIMIAASRGHLKTIEHLIRKDAKIDRIEEGNGETALHFASRHGHYDCVQFLVEHSSSVASTKIRNKFGKSPYDIAVENHHTAIADFLRI